MTAFKIIKNNLDVMTLEVETIWVSSENDITFLESSLYSQEKAVFAPYHDRMKSKCQNKYIFVTDSSER